MVTRSNFSWRLMVPIIIVMGLGITLWSGLHLLGSAKESWQQNLRTEAGQDMLRIQAQWERVNTSLSGLQQTFSVSEEVTAQEFAMAIRLLKNKNPAILSGFYLPGLSTGYTMPYAQPNTAAMARLQVALEKTLHKYPLPPNKAVVRTVEENMPANSVFLGMRLQDNTGALFLLIDIPTLLHASQLTAGAGVTQQIVWQGLPVLTHEIQPLPQGEEEAYSYSLKARWSEADWLTIWRFSATSMEGMHWLAGVLVLLIGGVFTTLFAWLVWAQQGVSELVQQQVVERTNQLEQASRRFRLITDNAYDLIGITSIEGVLEYVNSAYHRVLGYSREELRGQQLTDLIHEKDIPTLHKALVEVAKGRNAVELSLRMKHKNGHWLFMEAVAKGLHDTDWTVKNTVIHCRDVTSRKQFADDLARSEQRFRDFADASADWLWEVDNKLHFTYVSPGVTKVLGYESGEMIGHMQFEALFDRESDPTRDLIETRVQRHQPYRDIEFWTRSKEGERICLRISGVPVLDAQQNFAGYRGVASNITAGKKVQDDMYRLAMTDHLTGLLNRRRFMEELERSVSLARRHKTQGVLMFIDLDRFKEINDTHGHEAGDDILRGITDILKKSFRSTDIVARLGGDEFAIIMHNISSEGAQEKVQEVIERINGFEIDYKDARLSVTMSIGMVTYPQEDKDGDGLMMAADLAMYRAKDMGRNRVYVDDASTSVEDIDSVRSQLKWVKRLRTCLETGDFEMHFQPIVPSRKQVRPLFEALLRIYDEDGNIGSPAIYIDAAEHFGLIQQLDLSVVERCFQTQYELEQQGYKVDFSVNLSSRSLGDKEVMQKIRDLLNSYDITPSHIMFEATETMALHDPSAFRELGEIHAFVTELRRMGFRFAIDDFGAGFSSFNYIRQLPVDVVKIDGSFVKDLEHSREDRYFIESMAMLCKGLGIETIAEFVENENILRELEELGVDYAQGWHVGKPLPNVAELCGQYQGKAYKDFIGQKPAFLQPVAPAAAPKKAAKKPAAKKAAPKAVKAPKKAAAPAKKKAPVRKKTAAKA